MKCIRVAGTVESITLNELLTRKMQDYGYDSLTALSNDLGIHISRISDMLKGNVIYPRKDVRVALCRVLDIAPEVLDRAIRNSMGGWK